MCGRKTHTAPASPPGFAGKAPRMTMPRPRIPPADRHSTVSRVRLRPAEDLAFKQLATALNQPPGRVLRRLVREAITGGPDFFADGVSELRAAHRELAAVGRNLNQLVRAANRGEVLLGPEIAPTLTALQNRVETVEQLYGVAVEAAALRTVIPLKHSKGGSNAA